MSEFSSAKVKRTAHILSTCIAILAPAAWAECNDALRATIAADRYAINADNTVIDQITDLVWMRCPAGFSWSAANSTCAGEGSLFTWTGALQYAVATGNGWRLPNTKELESLIKRNCVDPAVEVGVFSSLPLGFHWTSTAALEASGAWALNMRNGGLTVTDKTNLYSVRLVRDAK